MKARPFEINGIRVEPGERVGLELPVARLYTHTSLAMPVQVVHGKLQGPCLFVSAAIHGDELNGVEVIRRLLRHSALKRLRGTLVAIPIVNVHGFLDRSRYLPDRRDLNRSFPGSDKGSLAARIAKLFMTEVVARCGYGIDLHTGAIHRENMPQIRANLDDPETERLAHAFGVPVLINSTLRDGSLRMAASEQGVTTLLYEAGEALRFDEISIRAGLKGVLNVMRELNMLPARKRKATGLRPPVVARSSSWVRAPESGILRTLVTLGTQVEKDTLLAVIADPFGEDEMEVRAQHKGIVIGRTQLPLVHQGEAVYHLAQFTHTERAARSVEVFQEATEPDPTAYDDEPEPPIQ
jgi:predicted deacylase